MNTRVLTAIAVVVASGFGAWAAEDVGGLLPEQVAALRAIARGEVQPWTPMTPAQAAALHAKAEAQWQELQKHHLPFGQVVDVYWTDYTQTKIARYETVGDSTCWTGHYLAALAMRYKATPDPAILQKIKDTLGVFDMLTKVSGRIGYIARFAGDADDEAYREYYKVYGRGEDPDRPGYGKWAYQGVEPYTNLVWLGNSSRDTYIGFNLGISAVWANVDDPEVRAKIKDIVTTVGKRMVEDDWFIIDGKGHKTNPTPWFKLSWMRTVITAAPGEFPKVEEDYSKMVGPALKMPRRVYPKTYKEYFANNLAFGIAYSLYAMEPDPELKKQFAESIAEMYDGVKDHLNAHSAMMYLAATGEDNEAARATVVGQLIDLPGPPRWFHAVDHRNDPGVEFKKGDKYLKYSLLAHEQVPTDFLWQRSPTLSYGSVDAPYMPPGLDLVLPYWMGRAYGVIPAPSETEDMND